MSDINTNRLDRFKSAPWFTQDKQHIFYIIGQGGIGSHLAFQLSRLGNHIMMLHDFDNFEAHNLAGQLASKNDVGIKKTEAMRKFIDIYSPGTDVRTIDGKYDENSYTNKIMFMALDNLEARKIAFDKWYDAYKGNPDAIFIDGRLLANEWQVITMSGTNVEEHKDTYLNNYFFEKTEENTPLCTFKQTTYVASQIASFMVSVFTNWLSLKNSETPDVDKYFFQVPFQMSFNTELMKLNVE